MIGNCELNFAETVKLKRLKTRLQFEVTYTLLLMRRVGNDFNSHH